MTIASEDLPLAGLRVVEFTHMVMGPTCGLILADLGAEVIKVERPGAGDDTRSWGPPFLKDATGQDTKEAGYYLAVNRGKRSITVSLEKPEGQKIVRELAAWADIVLENYKAGTLARYGLDEASLRKVNPRLIYCSVTGFGQTGPRRDQPAYDFLIQAMGGLMSVTGEKDGRPGGGPQKVGVPIVDLMTGMYTAVSVLAALARRDQTGEGGSIDIAMLDVQVATLANQAMNYLVSGKVPSRNGNAHPNIQPQDVYACADGDLILVVGNDGQFAKLCETLGHPEWAQDPRFTSNTLRVINRAELIPLMEVVFKTRTKADWLSTLEAAKVPCGPINNLAEVFADPHVQSREMINHWTHSSGGEMDLVASPLKLRGTPVRRDRPPPTMGQHTDEVLHEVLGLDASALAALRDQKII